MLTVTFWHKKSRFQNESGFYFLSCYFYSDLFNRSSEAVQLNIIRFHLLCGIWPVFRPYLTWSIVQPKWSAIVSSVAISHGSILASSEFSIISTGWRLFSLGSCGSRPSRNFSLIDFSFGRAIAARSSCLIKLRTRFSRWSVISLIDLIFSAIFHLAGYAFFLK